MWRCPPASGTPFITRPRAKKKPRGPTEESRPKQNLLVYPRTPPHRQVDAILPAASSTLERASELIDAKERARVRRVGRRNFTSSRPQPSPHFSHSEINAIPFNGQQA